jgi:hypothetical protein
LANANVESYIAKANMLVIRQTFNHLITLLWTKLCSLFHDTMMMNYHNGFLVMIGVAWVGHSNMYLITHMRRKGIYHGAIYLRNWNCLHPISIDKSKFYHFR